MQTSFQNKDEYAIYFHCSTTLVSTFREIYPKLTYEKNRAIIFNKKDKLAIKKITHCIELALKYHLEKKLFSR